MTSTPWRILIAEDDAGLATLIEAVLENDGRFEVVGRAADGHAAVKLTHEHRPDLVLMDIGMPGRNGIEATRLIHAQHADQHVVIYTGSGEYDDVARAAEAGAVGYLHKEALTSPDLPEALHVLHTNYLSGVGDPD